MRVFRINYLGSDFCQTLTNRSGSLLRDTTRMRSCRKKPKRSANVRSGALQRRRTEAAGIMAKPLANLLLPGTPPKIARGLVGHATTDSKTVSWQSLLHQKLFTPATPLFIKYLQAIDNLRTPVSHTRCAILNTVEEVRRRKRLRHHRGGAGAFACQFRKRRRHRP